jgi:hypothetical protein
MKNQFSVIGILALGVIGGCSTGKVEIGPPQIVPAGSLGDLTFLDQEWDAEERDEFYNTPQGNLIIPYDWYLHLETAESKTSSIKYFWEKENIQKTGYLLAPVSERNMDGKRPVGFTMETYTRDWFELETDDKDKNKNKETTWLGMNCAACHTNQINYRTHKIRIDGAPALASFFGFLEGLNAALESTLAPDKPGKFDRFADKTKETDKEKLRQKMSKVLAIRKGWTARNNPKDPSTGDAISEDGYGRLDAFGSIFNEAEFMAKGTIPHNKILKMSEDLKYANLTDAPVSYPFLWGARWHNWVQWPGNVPKKPAIARNFVQVVGVFGRVDVTRESMVLGAYKSTARFKNMRRLADMIKSLRSPQWPESIFGEIDKSDGSKWARGKVLFGQYCVACHTVVKRDEPQTDIDVHLTKLGKDPKYKECASAKEKKKDREANDHDGLNTDDRTVKNIQNRMVASGLLKGRRLSKFFLSKLEEDKVTGAELVGHLFARSLQDHFISETVPVLFQLPGSEENCFLDRYKGRSLDGIWATAPYLHNGSVPTLKDLLRRPEKREPTFWVGSREFKPIDVGFKYKDYKKGEGSEVNTLLVGNKNTGHVYPTKEQLKDGLSEDDMDALVIYQKSL